MKKSILFLATLLCTLAASVTVINGTPNPGEYGRVRYWVHTAANPGDTILLADGTYDEQSVINFNKEGIVVMAKEGATPIIKTKGQWMIMNITATTTFEGITFKSDDSDRDKYAFDNSANATFRNCTFKDFTDYIIKAVGTNGTESLVVEDCVFDGEGVTPTAILIEGNALVTCQNSTFTNHVDYSISVESGANTSLTIDGCEFDGTNTTKAALFTKGIVSECDIQGTEFKNFAECAITVEKWYGGRYDELTIDSCLIHDCTKSAIYLPYAIDTNEKQTCSDFTLKKSTIYNIGNGDSFGTIDIQDNANIASEQQVLVDHVTIYNFLNSGWHGAIKVEESANAVVSNCIVMNTTQEFANPYKLYTGAQIKNSIYYNTEYPNNGATTTKLEEADPMFVDAANGNFQLYAESPAVGAGTDGSNLGDPRWGVKAGLQPGSGKLKAAVNAAQTGATIELGDGVYEEPSSIDFNKEGLIIKAAEGTKPVVKASSYLKHNATTTFIGITFDGQDVAEYTTYSYETDTEKDLTFINCEFKGYTKSCVTLGSAANVNKLLVDGCTFDGESKTPAAIKSSGIISECVIQDSEIKGYKEYGFVANSSSAHTEELSIDNCIIHDCGYAAVYVCKASDSSEKQSCSSFELTNSTIYNVGDNTKDHGAVDIRDNANIASAQQVLIDHVTLYNFNTKDWYGGFMIYQSANATISNCIVSNPADLSGKNGYHIYGNALVTNSLYNNCSVISGAQEANNIAADPLFVDAANANFKLSANSPAIGKGTDGSNLGDPRWGVSASLKGKVINITPGQAQLNNAVGDASMGDTIVLADGTYDEPWGFNLDKEGLVVMAAEGAKPVVNMSSYFKHYATVTFIGITFDAENNGEHAIYSYDNTAKNLILKSCVFSNYPKYMLTSNNTAHIDSVIIDDCIFNNSGRSVVYYPQATLDDNVPTCSYFKMTNSTVYNVGNYSGVAAIDIRENQNALGAGGNEIIIDHITMYNFATAYGAILVQKSPKTTISNSIIANPTNSDLRAFLIYSGAKVKNSLHFNTTAEWVSNAYTDTIKADPLFVDAANGNFKLKGNSLAVYAGTDGTTLGDPRWGITPLELNGEGDDAKVLSNYNGKVADVKITRNFVTDDGYNTICLPFDMPANKIGKAYQIETINAYANNEIEVKFAPVTTLLAGQPYLIVPNKTELEEVKQVTITNQAGTTNTVSGGGVSIKMTGVLSENGTTSGLYWVGEQGWLYNGDVRKLGLRAYFEIDINTPSGIAPRMRVVTSENETTGLDNITTNEKAIKAIVNGQLVIIRGGEMYNVQGQKL